MSYITKSVTIIITLTTFCDVAHSQSYIKQYTRKVVIKQGVLQGIVIEPKVNRILSPVEQYLGIPYAAPPVGGLRYMPTGSAPPWRGVKYCDSFGPVCPQKFPDEKFMSAERREYFLRLKEFLENQSEDCLYLNIYAPFQGMDRSPGKYPVMVFIHGESFEWNSGNPYDGSVLASYGKVIVVTLNFRLGILGFLKAGTEVDVKSNFGLVDQIAALLWVKENIAAFGGDPGSVTLFGHGTGAVCASHLMLSPLAHKENQMLFQRAILMGGTALADWALAGNALDVAYQVANELNCQIQDDFGACLRRKRLDDIMAASAKTPNYTTQFGPVVDGVVVPNDPKKSMTQYSDIFRRFELMYGVTELESIHLLGPVALTHGMLEKERDQELGNYLRTRCEMKPELCLMRTLTEYTDGVGGRTEYTQDDGRTLGQEPDRATLARDALLDILSDARSVAPVVQMARYHAALNLQSYFYVFTHKTISKEYIRNKSFNGEELPYVFGVPLDGPRFHFVDQYTKQERLFSEIIMTYFCNFAATGNPNVPRKTEFVTLSPTDWNKFDVEWPEFDLSYERYVDLDIPPKVSSKYRNDKVTYWNNIFPQLVNNRSLPPISTKKPNKIFLSKNPLPWLHQFSKTSFNRNKFENFNKPYEGNSKSYDPKSNFGVLKKFSEGNRPDNIVNKVSYGTVLNSPTTSDLNQANTMNILIIIGGLFLLANLLLFIGLYYKCYKIKKNNTDISKSESHHDSRETDKLRTVPEKTYIGNGCNLVQMIRKSSKSDDTYEAVKADENGSAKRKLSRQMSSSTIDAHTKVRDWITNEIIYKYSPRFFRARHPNAKKTNSPEDICISIDTEKDSTLGRSPTRPVSPADDKITPRPILIKSSSLNSNKQKLEKISVAIDATPTGRGPSVLMQQPIELTKSLDCPNYSDSELPLRRSVTLEDFSPRAIDCKKEMRKSTTSINLKYAPENEPTIIKIEHAHSKSEPVQDLSYSTARKLRTFDPKLDINVTCKDEDKKHVPLSPEESLQTIKRRNFPKVLPDHPGREVLLHKRMSMPAHSLFMPIPELSSFSQPNSPTNKSLNKLPPAPPPRTSSTLVRQQSNTSNTIPLGVSEPKLAEEPPALNEPELTCNNLYVGPLIPRNHKIEESETKLNTQPVYDSLRNIKSEEKSDKISAKTIISANPNCPIKRVDPKIVVRPNTTRKASDGSTKTVARVVVPDNQPQLQQKIEKTETKAQTDIQSAIPVKVVKPVKKSQIPTLVKNSNTSLNKESSSSESTPSEESDTGTVVKRI